MTEEKPLHVLVAAELGWTNLTEHLPALPGMEPIWIGDPPESAPGDHQFISEIDHATRTLTVCCGSVPRYDTDWAATGPLIEKHKIEFHAGRGSGGFGWMAAYPPSPDDAFPETPLQTWFFGETLLIAACRLLVGDVAGTSAPIGVGSPL